MVDLLHNWTPGRQQKKKKGSNKKKVIRIKSPCCTGPPSKKETTLKINKKKLFKKKKGCCIVDVCPYLSERDLVAVCVVDFLLVRDPKRNTHSFQGFFFLFRKEEGDVFTTWILSCVFGAEGEEEKVQRSKKQGSRHTRQKT